MTPKQRLKRQLLSMRQMSERLLADFKTPAEWVYQIYPGANHALWFAGHMANTDNFLISLVTPEKARKAEEFADKFGMGSQPTNDAAHYPAPAAVLAEMRERRETLLGILEGLSDEQLSQATPQGAPDFLPDFASVFELAIWHEGVHRGQLTVVRRALGHPPLSG